MKAYEEQNKLSGCVTVAVCCLLGAVVLLGGLFLLDAYWRRQAITKKEPSKSQTAEKETPKVQATPSVPLPKYEEGSCVVFGEDPYFVIDRDLDKNEETGVYEWVYLVINPETFEQQAESKFKDIKAEEAVKLMDEKYPDEFVQHISTSTRDVISQTTYVVDASGDRGKIRVLNGPLEIPSSITDKLPKRD